MSEDFDKLSDFSLMLGCLGKIKNANYSEFGLGVNSDKNNNTYYYNLFLQAVNDKIIRLDNTKGNTY